MKTATILSLAIVSHLAQSKEVEFEDVDHCADLIRELAELLTCLLPKLDFVEVDRTCHPEK